MMMMLFLDGKGGTIFALVSSSLSSRRLSHSKADDPMSTKKSILDLGVSQLQIPAEVQSGQDIPDMNCMIWPFL